MFTSVVRFADADGADWDVFFAVPESVNGEDAPQMVLDAYEVSRESNPDDWSWGDVLKILEPQGFSWVDMVTVGEA
jgi:hypothetical protein